MFSKRSVPWLRRILGSASRLFQHHPRLVVPEQFNRNSPTVTSIMTPEESGSWLLERLQARLSLPDLSQIHLLDFGCGVRFTQALINRRIPIASYTGVDCFPEMIHFLRSSVPDRRFQYHVFDVHNRMYNLNGQALTASTQLPVPRRDYDVITLFSVITHQYPDDSRALFTILRRHVARDGHLFFTCFLDPALDTFEDRSPERNAGRCFYGQRYLTDLVEACGWSVVDISPAEPPLIGDSFLIRPANG